ncbi:MAG: acyltransferase [Candidatus Thiodiazotropha sp. (ex Lucinoma borealis)]|nr:acyltransferase [Candidatus Thiodiazotropha sp. (ex Lucinoma borealis)]
MNKLNNLQILRAIAASSVVFTHAFMTYSEKIQQTESYYYNHGGDLGVKLFFCISGFIIYRSAMQLETAKNQAYYFLIRRLIRIAPIYWIATLVYVYKDILLGMFPNGQELLFSLFFLPFIRDDLGLMRPVLGLGWSLNYEMFFYVVLSISIFITTQRRFTFILGVLLIFLILFHDGSAYERRDIYEYGYQLLATNYLYYFIVGMAVGKFGNSLLRYVYSFSGSLIPLLIVFEIGLYLTILSVFESFRLYSEILDLILCTVILCQSYVADVTQKADRKPYSRIKSSLILAGDGSYSTYLFHWLLLGITARIITFFDITIAPLTYAVNMVVLCNIMGILMYTYIEKPLTASLNTRYAKKVKYKYQPVK